MTIKNCATCKKAPADVKEYIEAILDFDGTSDSDIDADELIIEHMDAAHGAEIERLCAKKTKLIKELIRQATS